MQKSLIGQALSGIVDFLYPSDCPLCGVVSDRLKTAPICGDCWDKIKPLSGARCRVCSHPIESIYASICGDCIVQRPPFAMALAYGEYDGALAEAIKTFKFVPRRSLAEPLSHLLLELNLPGADLIVPTPLYIKGLRKREFNQSALLAARVSDKTGSVLALDVLVKTRKTLPQFSLREKARRTNLRGAFKTIGRIDGKSVLLVDDVMTTGATASECSRTLLKAGASEVTVAVLARAALM